MKFYKDRSTGVRPESASEVKETLAVSSLACVVLVILSWPAFKYFFLGEAFGYVQSYNLHGRHLFQAAFSNQGGIFFRPGFFLSEIWWHFVLPPVPMIYHLRNLVFVCLNIFLLHRVLLKFVKSRPARVIALGLFSVSKIHLTVIGRIAVYEDAILLLFILLSVLFWFRYIEARRFADYWLALIFCICSVYSKDHGLVLSGVLAAILGAIALKPGLSLFERRSWLIRFTPFVLISISNLVLRYILTGPINPNQEAYSPRFSLSVLAWQSKGFIASIGNFSLTRVQSMGARGLSGLLAEDSTAVELTLCVGLWLLIFFTVWQARSCWRVLIVPLVWIGLYLSPILLIRNHNIWYYQEPVVGMALLIGLCLAQAKRALVATWSVVVVLIAINGFVSNRRSDYDWQGAANQAEAIVKSIMKSQAGTRPKSIVFVTTPGSLDYWDVVVGGAMVPEILRSPETTVDIVTDERRIPPGGLVYHLP